tara:strand:- start:461 stop:940 length:480 start_codon:yes stop_codon:yes gene_type:complete
MNQNENIQFNLNFGGFYCSEHAEVIENRIESFELDWETVNFKQVHRYYASDWLELLSNEIDIDLKFIELDSPKYYNYRTDEIITEISKANFKALKAEYLTTECIDYINTESASRSGFMSFYSGIDAVSKEPSILAAYIFSYILESEEIEIDLSEINLNL